MVKPSGHCWRGRRVLITGHTGFKGSWLTLWLTQMGAIVCGYALEPPASPNLYHAARVAERIANPGSNQDICDGTRLQRVMADFAPEVVFHLAAQPLVRRSYVEPALTYATNVMGTVNVLEAIRATPSVRAVVSVTTDKCYENREWPWGYRENDQLGGHDPYSSSKACAELVCAAYRTSFFAQTSPQVLIAPVLLAPVLLAPVLLATARAGNVIGGGDWSADRLVPDLLRGFIAGRSVPIRNPEAIRPWQHVLEPLRGYLLLAERLLRSESQFASAWNFGPDDQDTQSVGWIADRLTRMWPIKASWQSGRDDQVHEATHLKLDCSKARSLLNWRPALTLDQALQLTVEWTRHWQAGDDMQQVTLNQIAAYEAVCSLQSTPQSVAQAGLAPEYLSMSSR